MVLGGGQFAQPALHVGLVDDQRAAAGTRGVVYQLYRSIDGGDREYIGGAGRREFVDNTLPAGAITIIYTIQATRTTTVGVETDFRVKIGGDARTAAKPVKIAA